MLRRLLHVGLPPSLRIERQPGLHPCIEPAVEWVHTFPTMIGKFLCHTGTGCFARSSAVSNNSAIMRNLVEVLINFLSRDSERAGQFLIRLSPRGRIPCIQKCELLTAVQPLCNFVSCNSCNFHGSELRTGRKRGYHELNKFLLAGF